MTLNEMMRMNNAVSKMNLKIMECETKTDDIELRVLLNDAFMALKAVDAKLMEKILDYK